MPPRPIGYTTMTIVHTEYEHHSKIIESTFYLCFFTKDPRFLQMGKRFFNSLVKYTRNDVAYAALSDVEKKLQRDDMESCFFAEALKYLYVLPGPPNTISLKPPCLRKQTPYGAPGRREER